MLVFSDLLVELELVLPRRLEMLRIKESRDEHSLSRSYRRAAAVYSCSTFGLRIVKRASIYWSDC